MGAKEVLATFRVTWNTAKSAKKITLPPSDRINVGDEFTCRLGEENGNLTLTYTLKNKAEVLTNGNAENS